MRPGNKPLPGVSWGKVTRKVQRLGGEEQKPIIPPRAPDNWPVNMPGTLEDYDERENFPHMPWPTPGRRVYPKKYQQEGREMENEFCPLAGIFIDEYGKKHIGPYFLENSLSPLSLAYWLMNHGGLLSYNKDYPRRALVLNCHAFPQKECEILRNNLNRTYNFSCWCKKNQGKTIIAVPARKWQEFRDLVAPHVLEEMRYKFPHWYS